MAVGDQVRGQGNWVYDDNNRHWYPWVEARIKEETLTSVTVSVTGGIFTGPGDGTDHEDAYVQSRFIRLGNLKTGYDNIPLTITTPVLINQGRIDIYGSDFTISKGEGTKSVNAVYSVEGTENGFYSDVLAKIVTSDDLVIDSLPSYTITYIGNATNVTNIPSAQTKYYNKSITLKTQIPVRTGYTFKGWSVSDATTAPEYKAGETYVYPDNADLTLYAAWVPTIYTITYDKNGGTWLDDISPASQTKEYNRSITLSSIKPTRVGYDFVNWNTNPDGTGSNYSAGGIYAKNANAVMYAQWTPKRYTVTYNANGGANAPSTGTKIHDEPYTLSNDVPTRTNYIFIGWGTNSSDTTPIYKVGETNIYTKNEPITLYAIWVSSTYTVTYNRNNGNWTGPSTQIKNYNESLTLTSIEPTLDGYSFAGWGTNPDGTGSNYVAGGTYTKNENITLYALWRYTVIYNANGGTGTMSSSSALLGTPLQLRANSFIKNQYDFDGWATSVEGAKIYDNQALFVGRNTTLYAHWIEKPKGWINKIRLLTGPVGNRTTNDFVIGTTFDQVQYSESNGATLLDLANSLKTFFGSRMFMFYKGKEPMNRNVMQWYQVVAATENPTSTETTIANS